MTHVISFINLKGGVAKTTSAVQLADTLATFHQKRVLVLDLDAQTNATLALIGEERWAKADDQGQTLAQLFIDQVAGTTRFDLPSALMKGVSNISVVQPELIDQLPDELKYGRIDLLPSSIQLIDVQDRMQDIGTRSYYALSPMEVIQQFVAPIFSHYDVVIIDCPPNLGYITQNGLEVSDYYLIPTIPDRLSTYGIRQIVAQIGRLRRARGLPIGCLGVLVTKYQSNSPTLKRGLEQLPGQIAEAFADSGEPVPPILSTIIPQTTAFAEAMVFERKVKNYKEKYGSGKAGGQETYKYGVDLATEVLELLGE